MSTKPGRSVHPRPSTKRAPAGSGAEPTTISRMRVPSTTTDARSIGRSDTPSKTRASRTTSTLMTVELRPRRGPAGAPFPNGRRRAPPSSSPRGGPAGGDERLAGDDEARGHHRAGRGPDAELAHDREKHVGLLRIHAGAVGYDVDRGPRGILRRLLHAGTEAQDLDGAVHLDDWPRHRAPLVERDASAHGRRALDAGARDDAVADRRVGI